MTRPLEATLAPRDLEKMATNCLLMRSRYVARAITAIYEDELRAFGIKGSQLNVLIAIAYAGTIRRTELGEILHLDASTLTRNLRVMETSGWIEDVADDADGRGLPVRATTKGRALIATVEPAWKVAQRRASRYLGDGGATMMRALSSEFG